jgi:hypothetical protein
MNIPDFLAPSDVMINVATADKQKLLQVLARKSGIGRRRRPRPPACRIT